jgi:predicted NBD/HSP70 family sugar kinase
VTEDRRIGGVARTRGLTGATQDVVRRHNLAAVLSGVHLRGQASRAELTAALGLNRSTIGALTGDLVAAGLVVEAVPELPGRSAGRPSLLVVPRDDVYVLAVHLGVEGVVAARVALGGRVLDRVLARHEDGGTSPDAVVARIADAVLALDRRGGPGRRCAGIAVAVCGIVRQSDGMVRMAPNLGWTDVPLGRRLAEIAGPDVPVALRNEADLGALAEHLRGAAVGVDDVIFVFGEVGIGGGVLAGGRPVSGRGGYAGEVGHLMVNPAGRTCRCGKVGCWETEVSIDALVSVLGPTGADRTESVRRVLAAAADGVEPARAAVEEFAHWLAVGVGQLVTVFNPEMIILGGMLPAVFAQVRDDVGRKLRAVALPAALEQVRLAVPALGGDAPLLGAAELAFAPLLADPLGVIDAATAT